MGPTEASRTTNPLEAALQTLLHLPIPQSQASTPRDLLCCLLQALARSNLSYQNLFRILIVQFIDADSFDLRSIRKTCIHIAHPDAQRLIPFDTYNLFYRDDLEQTRLAPLRQQAAAAL